MLVKISNHIIDTNEIRNISPIYDQKFDKYIYFLVYYKNIKDDSKILYSYPGIDDKIKLSELVEKITNIRARLIECWGHVIDLDAE